MSSREPPFCPHCGYNFEADAPVEIGGWTVTPLSTWFNGQEIKLPPQRARFLHTLALARGRWVSREAILNRISDCDADNLVSVVATRLRYQLGAFTPFEGAIGRGFRWKADGQPGDHPTHHPAERLGEVDSPVHGEAS